MTTTDDASTLTRTTPAGPARPPADPDGTTKTATAVTTTTTTRAAPTSPAARMRCLDTTHNSKVPILMEMVGSVSRATTPQELYRRFRAGISRIATYSAYLALSVRNLQPGEYKITHFEKVGPGGFSDSDPWSEWNSLPTYRGGFIGELIRSAWPELIHYLEVPNDPAVGDLLAPYRSLMAVPLFDNGEPLNWSIMLSEEPEHFQIQNLEESILRANLIGGMTKNTVVTQELRKAHERIHDAVDQIASIQRSLLPDPLPEIEGVELAAKYETSEKAGGDYYDFFALDFDEKGEPKADGRWGILIADASGHGPSAAVVMAMLHAILHAFPEISEGPAKALQHANRQLCAKRLEGSFVTAFFGVYDAKKRTLTYARAGHPPPIVKDNSSLVRLDQVGDIPLGVSTDWNLEENTVEIRPGQTVIFYTDGVTEAMDREGRLFGIAGIERALEHCSGAPECSVESITEALQSHEHGTRIRDDQTLVAMRVNDERRLPRRHGGHREN